MNLFTKSLLFNCLLPFLSIIPSITSTSLGEQLRYFETLKLKDLTHKITKRGIQPSQHKYNVIKELSFKALGRDFRLILNPTKGLLSSHFKAYTVDGKGQKQPVWVDKDQFYEGRVFGEVDSDVTAHIDEGLLTAAIQTPQDTYIVEPSWRHVPDDDNASMIIYKGSDVKFSWETNHKGPELPKFCGFVKEDGNASDASDVEEPAGTDNEIGKSPREKRQSVDAFHWEPVQTRCSLLLVADYRFYENMGGKNLKGTINFLISLIDRVNKIFLETEWKDNEKQDGFRGMGFVIQEIMVHTEATPTLRGEVHYNMQGGSWNVRDLLEVFSRNLNHRWFCLAHLFTDQKFDGGILGLAYVGSPRRNSVGGICSPGYVKNGYTLYLNSGLSTSRNHYGQKVITREADLVTAHEFGHNWGSEHDPDIPECSPDSQGGGSYLMYTYSVSGYDPNNKKFSPCSVRSIRAVLLAKASKCFSKPEESFCGNSLVEEGEECDAGLIGSENTDPCCDTNCRLRPGAICCDKNTPCCSNCRLVGPEVPCREAEQATCKEKQFCSGKSADCPPSSPQLNDTECQDRGRCRAGDCVPFCETMKMFSCMCDTEKDACKRCCRPSVNASCVPFEPVEILRDGTPCIHGYCDKGKCEKTVQDIVERFWDIIEEININSVMKFLNDNIVGTVLLVSIVVWVPASCLISYVDRRRREESSKNINRKIRERVPAFRPPTNSGIRLIHLNSNRSRDNVNRSMPMPRAPPSRDPYAPVNRGYSSHYNRAHERGEPRPYMSRSTDYHSPRSHAYRQDHGWGSSQGSGDPRPSVRPKPASLAGMESFTSL